MDRRSFIRGAVAISAATGAVAVAQAQPEMTVQDRIDHHWRELRHAIAERDNANPEKSFCVMHRIGAKHLVAVYSD